MKTFTTYNSDFQTLSQNTSTANATLGMKFVNDALRYLVGTFFFNEATYTVPGGSVASQAAYNLPFNNKQVVNTTVLIGSVLWQPREVATRKAYDALNVIPFVNNFPQFYYIWNSQLLLWPAPADNGQAITINYKRRIKDLSVADVTGTVSVTTLTTTVTGTGFTTNMAGKWLNIASTTSDTTSGDDEWYQIASVTNSTTLVLANQYQGQTVTGGTSIIGEVPILPEDFQDLPLYRALYIYHTSINHDAQKAQYYKALYDEGYKRLDAEFGAKTSSVGLTEGIQGVVSPNLFQQNISYIP